MYTRYNCLDDSLASSHSFSDHLVNPVPQHRSNISVDAGDVELGAGAHDLVSRDFDLHCISIGPYKLGGHFTSCNAADPTSLHEVIDREYLDYAWCGDCSIYHDMSRPCMIDTIRVSLSPRASTNESHKLVRCAPQDVQTLQLGNADDCNATRRIFEELIVACVP